MVLGPVLLVSMDGSILFPAMPDITEAISPTADQALWILDVYGFAVGSPLVAFGSVGDRYGPLKLLMTGATVFGIGSAGAAFAPNPELLIACRALVGVAGATLLPSALAVLSEPFPDPKQRARAIGIFAAAFAPGFAIGPVVGGALLGRFWWGSVFLVNLPVIVVFLAFAPVLLREVRETRTGRIDLVSVAASAGGLLLTIYGIKHLAADGLSVLPVVTGLLGLVALTFFALRQRHPEHPLIDFSLFRDRTFTIAIITGLLPLAAWSATAYPSGIYLQSVLGLSVPHAALLALPGAAVLTISCIATPAFVERIGKKAALIVCHFTIAGGLLLLLSTTVTGGVGWYVASTAIAGVGYGISFSVVADTAVGAVPAERAGPAGAIAETSNGIGNALGIRDPRVARRTDLPPPGAGPRSHPGRDAPPAGPRARGAEGREGRLRHRPARRRHSGRPAACRARRRRPALALRGRRPANPARTSARTPPASPRVNTWRARSDRRAPPCPCPRSARLAPSRPSAPVGETGGAAGLGR